LIRSSPWPNNDESTAVARPSIRKPPWRETPVADDRKTFEHEWILEPFAEHRTFFTRRMFGGLAAYLFERQMLVLVEPTKSGRWNWHGVLVCTGHEHHASIRAEFPALMPHHVLRKWLFIDSTHQDFESTMEAVAKHLASNDPRFGILPRSQKLNLSRSSSGPASRFCRGRDR
jgi:hypothetical protein